jgi:hypothetical protein
MAARPPAIPSDFALARDASRRETRKPRRWAREQQLLPLVPDRAHLRALGADDRKDRLAVELEGSLSDARSARARYRIQERPAPFAEQCSRWRSARPHALRLPPSHHGANEMLYTLKLPTVDTGEPLACVSTPVCESIAYVPTVPLPLLPTMRKPGFGVTLR